jgi:pilus assembly protein FimV
MPKLTRTTIWISGVTLALGAGCCSAAGLGGIRLQSGLGEPLKLNIAVIGIEDNPQWYTCVKVRLESLDGTVVGNAKINVRHTAQTPSIQISSLESINEPVLSVVVDLGCDISVRRNYQILLDPVALLPQTSTAAYPSETDALPPFDSEKQQLAKPARSDFHPTQPPVKRRKQISKAVAIKLDKLSQQTAVSSKEKAPPRNVLRIALLEESDLNTHPAMNPQSAAPATPPVNQLPPASATSAGLATLSTSSPGHIGIDELSNSVQMEMMKALQNEVDILRLENSSIKLQGANDKMVMQSLQSELLAWIKGLGIVLAAFLAASAWLAWRYFSLRKGQNHSSWKALLPEAQAKPQPASNGTAGNMPERGLRSAQIIAMKNKPHATRAHREAETTQQIDTGLHFTTDGDQRPMLQDTFNEENLDDQENQNDQNDLASAEKNGKNHSAIKAEEISDVMELVAAWMALHKPFEVLELLEPFNRDPHPESPLPWLCLLDVYNSMNDQEKYQAIGKRIKGLFNVKVSDWEDRTNIGQANLVNFPHVVNKILTLWDSEEIDAYLESLLLNDRDGSRAGFDLAIYRDIARLHILAKDPKRPRQIDQLRKIKACAVLFAQLTDPVTPDAAKTTAGLARSGQEKTVDTYEYGGRYEGFSRDSYESEAGTSANPAEILLNEPELLLPGDSAPMPSQQSGQADAPKVSFENPQDPLPPSPAALNHFMSPMAVKLNLAIAYQDIGDTEGANLLLEEITKEGTPEQIEQAIALLTMRR